MQRADLNPGDMAIVLNGTEYILRPSFRAAMLISAIHGGFMPLVDRLGSVDIATMASVLVAGAGLSGKEQIEKAEQDLYLNGELGTTSARLIDFCGTLSNGGKPRAEAGTDAAEIPTTGAPAADSA